LFFVGTGTANGSSLLTALYISAKLYNLLEIANQREVISKKIIIFNNAVKPSNHTFHVKEYAYTNLQNLLGYPEDAGGNLF
jgi:hypothetical protein